MAYGMAKRPKTTAEMLDEEILAKQRGMLPGGMPVPSNLRPAPQGYGPEGYKIGRSEPHPATPELQPKFYDSDGTVRPYSPPAPKFTAPTNIGDAVRHDAAVVGNDLGAMASRGIALAAPGVVGGVTGAARDVGEGVLRAAPGIIGGITGAARDIGMGIANWAANRARPPISEPGKPPLIATLEDQRRFGGMGAVRMAERNTPAPEPAQPQPDLGNFAGPNYASVAGARTVAGAMQRRTAAEAPTTQQRLDNEILRKQAETDPGIAARLRKIDAQQLRNARMRNFDGLTDPATEAKVARRFDLDRALVGYNAAEAPLQKVQTAGDIQNRHSELGRNLVDNMRTRLRDAEGQILAAETMADGPEKDAALSAARTARMEANLALERTLADPHWGQMSGDQAAGIASRQADTRARQEKTRAAGEALIGLNEDGRRQYAADQRALQEASVLADINEQKARGAVAEGVVSSGGLSPEQRLAQAQASAEIARLNREEAARQNGVATPEEAKVRAEQSNAAMQIVGLDTPEAQQRFQTHAAQNIGDLIDSINAAFPMDQAEESLAKFNESTMPYLDQLEQLDPASAKRVALDLLAFIPSKPKVGLAPGVKRAGASTMIGQLLAPGPTGAMLSPVIDRLTGQSARNQQAADITTELRKRLEKIAGLSK